MYIYVLHGLVRWISPSTETQGQYAIDYDFSVGGFYKLYIRYQDPKTKNFVYTSQSPYVIKLANKDGSTGGFIEVGQGKMK